MPMMRIGLALVVVALLGGACRGSGQPSSARPSTTAAAGSVVALNGTGASVRMFGRRSSRGIVLIVPGDVSGWGTFAEELGRAGYRVALLASTTTDGESRAQQAAALVRREGAEKIVFIGGGDGAAAAITAARLDAAGVVLLAPSATSAAVLGGGLPPVPLLALSPLADAASAAAARRIYDAAVEPRTLALYPGSLGVPAVFTEPNAPDVRTVLTDFLRAAFEALSA